MMHIHRAEPGWSVDQRSLVIGENTRRIPVEFFVFVGHHGAQGLQVMAVYFGLIDGEMQALNGKLSYEPK